MVRQVNIAQKILPQETWLRYLCTSFWIRPYLSWKSNLCYFTWWVLLDKLFFSQNHRNFTFAKSFWHSFSKFHPCFLGGLARVITGRYNFYVATPPPSRFQWKRAQKRPVFRLKFHFVQTKMMIQIDSLDRWSWFSDVSQII